ncbi:hypothetical protein ScPMuIL_010819 [Solemya velum]
MSALEKQTLRQRLGALPPMPPPGVGGTSKRMLIKKRDFTPVQWNKYFERTHNVRVSENNVFKLYDCGSEGPVLFLLHGGGYSGLTWACMSAALSSQVKCRCVAVDLRGHGESTTSDDQDLSAETLSKDVADIVATYYGEEPPPIILVGHSMGGAIAAHTAQNKLIPSLIGLVVIDVVEGTALDALSSMQSVLRGRPSVFKSLENAIEWCVRSGQTKNLDAAKVSMVGQVKRLDIDMTASQELELETVANQQSGVRATIEEEEEEEAGSSSKKSKNLNGSQPSSEDSKSQSTGEFAHKYTWRTDLSKSEKYWQGWFRGLSQRFLSCEVPKMLLLAGVDRLDRDLTIGQMQGKFQMQVLPQCGHAVHEDVPDKVADVLATYMVRHRFAEPTADFQRTFPAC